MAKISNDWAPHLQPEYKKDYYKNLYQQVVEEYQTNQVFPPSEDIFNAFHYTPLSEVKVVILGQDPYHDVGQAHGLCFSVKPGIDIPPSLRNIYKEIAEDLGLPIPNHGYLVHWATQGVFMLNTLLTVRAHQPMSHQHIGWQNFTDEVIRIINRQDRPVVFMLWGKPAQGKAALLDNPNHLILTAPHPSPLSAHRGFFGCKHFSKANEFLVAHGATPIDWSIPDL